VPESSDRIAISISHVISGQAEGYFAITVLAVIALATLSCAAMYVIRRFPATPKVPAIKKPPTGAVKTAWPWE
jgi:hypothetical protein